MSHVPRARASVPSFLALLAALACACGDGEGDTPEDPSRAARSVVALRAGVTRASVRVDATGQASVTIPLGLLEAGNGLAPTLALAYYSGAESFGALGHGWALAPTSSVRRCPASVHVDGHDAGLALDDGDRACLDGQRLVVVSGTYFADGSTYRLLRDDATLVRFARASAADPGAWTVYRKSGEILSLGSSAASRHMHRSGQAIEWKVAELRDRSDNTITFAYQHDDHERDVRLAAIHYGGNSAAGLAPYRSVALRYEPATNPTLAFLAGHELERDQRLARVDLLADDDVVSSYRLGYEPLATGAGELLGSVQHCFADASCYPATRLTYSASGLALETDRRIGATYRPGDPDLRTLTLRRLIDVDNDGWDDVVSFNRAEIVVERANGAGHDAPVVRASGLPRTWSSRHNPALFYDVDADGYVDVLTTVTRTLAGVVPAEQTGMWVLHGGPAGFAPAVQVSRELGAGTEAQRLYMTMADADRDGRPDIFAFTDAGVRVFTLRDGRFEDATGDAITLPRFGLAQGWRFASHPREVADVNGDGFPDIVGFGERAVEVSLGHGFSFAAPTAWTSEFSAQAGALSFGVENHIRLLADANGDGLPDLVGFHRHGVLVGLNTGASFAPATPWLDDFGTAQGWTSASQLRTATDVNGDGFLDFVGVSPSRVHVVLGRGAPLGSVAELAPAQVVDVATSSAGFKRWQRSLYQLDLADVDSDGMTDLVTFLPEGLYALANRTTRTRLTAVTDGHGKRFELTYRPGNTPDVYRRTRDLAYPLVTLPAIGLVVSALTERAGGGPPHTLTYGYANGVVHRTGLGFLGFESWTIRDAAAETERVVTYSLDTAHAIAGLPVVDELVHVRGDTRTPLSRSETTWTSRVLAGGPAHRFVHASSTRTLQLDDRGHEQSRALVEQAYDARLDLTSSVTTVTDGFGTQKVTSTLAYGPADPARGLAGQVTGSVVRFERPGHEPVVNTAAFAYDAAGRLTTEWREPGTSLALETRNDRGNNPFGHVGATTRDFSPAEAAGLPGTRAVSAVTYDARGFVASVVNPLGHRETVVERDPATGLVLAASDANGLVTRFRHDADGQLVETTLPDGTTTRIARALCAADCPPGAVVRTTSTRTGVPPETIYEDAEGRVIRRETRALGGSTVVADTEYGFDGQLVRESAPYLAGTAPAAIPWTVHAYDGRRRLREVTRPDGTRERVERTGTTTTVIDARGARSSRTTDAQGRLHVITDARGGQVRHEYDAANRLVAIVDPAGHRTEMRHDALGRRVALVDPSLGTTTTRYNGLGLPVEVTDGAGAVTRHTYDLLGRLVESRARAGTALEEVSRWTYDAGARGVGRVARVENAEIARAFTYDALGRSTSTTVTLDGKSYHFGQSYDAAGRPATVTYPSGLAIENVYDDDGHLRAARNAASGRIYFSVEATHAWGAPRRVRHGNGLVTSLDADPRTARLRGTRTTHADGTDVVAQRYAYDESGNLTERHDDVTGAAETFDHDELDRLVSATRAGAAPQTVAYDALGNPTERSDVGAYRYGEACDGVTPGPFAVTSAGARRYCYDAKGQMVRGDGRTIRYGASDNPVAIVAPGASVDLRYGPLGERVAQVEQVLDRVTTVRYVGPDFEEITRSGAVEQRHYLGGGVIVVIAGGEQRELYSHTDHLGSVVAITDAAGALVERFAYDPWGQRRTVEGGLAGGADPTSRLGFTGHEHLEGVGLVHMGGRVYEPTLGRFLSPDPFVQDESDAQSLNRYSYVSNNPLAATDPSGFISIKSVTRSIGRALDGAARGLSNPGRSLAGAGVRLNKWVVNPQNQRMVAAIVISVAAAYAAPALAASYSGWAQWAVGAAVSGAGGFASGYVASDGNLDYARRSGLSSMACFAIGQYYMGQQLTATQMVTKAVAHGVVGGVSSAASGGSFESGFASSLASEALSLGGAYAAGADALRVDVNSAAYSAVSAAVVGGATSALTGGSFESGALSAALASLYNGYFHRVLARASGDVVHEYVHVNDGNPEEPCFPQYETVLKASLLHEGGIVYDPVAGALLELPVAGLTRAGMGLFSAAITRSELVTVTSWAEAGVTPDLAAGRWVQLGGASRANFWLTGLPGPKAYGSKTFPFFRLERSRVPLENAISSPVSRSSLQWPAGHERWKGLLGQRQIKP